MVDAALYLNQLPSSYLDVLGYSVGYVNNAVACCPKRIIGILWVGIPVWASGCTASTRSGVPPTAKGMPMRRPGRALSDLYRLGSEVVKVMKEAFIFGHSLTEKVPE